jgi:hypothetical protein
LPAPATVSHKNRVKKPSIAHNPKPRKGRQRNYSYLAAERTKEEVMLWTIFVILLVLWLLGLVTSYTLGGFIHILLVLAIIALVFQLISGRRTVV